MNKIVTSLFVCLMVFSGNLISQSISFQPSTISVEPCKDSISIQMSLIGNPADSISVVTFPLSDKWEYMDQTASISGNAQIDSVVIGNFLEFYLSGVNTSSQLTIQIRTTCEAIDATNYNFYQTAEYSRLMKNGSFSFSTDSLYFTVASPFLVLTTQLFDKNPTVGEVFVRKRVIVNTGSVPFTGAFDFNFQADLYAEIIGSTVQSTGQVLVTSQSSSIGGGSSSGYLTGFSNTDSLIFTDTVILKSCKIDSTITSYSFNYGCDSSNLCNSIGIEPFKYSTIQDVSFRMLPIEQQLDDSCIFSLDTMIRSVTYVNESDIVARNFRVKLYNLDPWGNNYNQAHYIPNEQNIDITVNGVSMTSDSIRYNTITCETDVISFAGFTADFLNPGDTVRISFKTLLCCDNTSRFIQPYRVLLQSDKYCSDALFTLASTNHKKEYALDQYFENLTPNIQIEAGDIDNMSEPVDFKITNVFANFNDYVKPRDTLDPNTLWGYYYELLSTDSSAAIEVRFLLDRGLRYEDSTLYMETSSESSFYYRWEPVSVTKKLGPAVNSFWPNGGNNDTIVARFDLPDFFYSKPNLPPKYKYDSLELFLTASDIHFQLRGICPGEEPISDLVQQIYLIPDTNCADNCKVLLSEEDSRIAVMCPGCVTPGFNTKTFSLTRSNIGFRDDDNNFFPDDTIPTRATDSLVAKKRVIKGDTLDLFLSGHFWSPGPGAVSNLGFDMKNMIVWLSLGDKLTIIDSTVKVVIYDASQNKRDTIMIPPSFFTTWNGAPTLNLHKDSLIAHGLLNAQNMEYYDASDQLQVYAKVLVVGNLGYGTDIDLIETASRVAASGVLADKSSCLAPECYDDTLTIQEKKEIRYACEFLGANISLVRLKAATNLNHHVMLQHRYYSIYANTVSPSQYIMFLNRGDVVNVEIGNRFDDSFPYEIRNFIRFDSVIVEQPQGYTLDYFKMKSYGTPKNGISRPIAFSSEEIPANGFYNAVRDKYIFFPGDHIIDTTAMPVLTDSARYTVVRDSVVFRMDEEEFFQTEIRLTPTICSQIIGQKIPFYFKGILKHYPLLSQPHVYEKTFEAYLPAMKLTTQVVSADTSYLREPQSSVFFDIFQESNKQPLTDSSSSSGQRYGMDVFDNVFARVIASSDVKDIVVKRANSTHPSYEMNYIDSLDLFEMRDVLRGRGIYKYELSYSYSCVNGTNNVLDSIVLITGWNCDGLPTDLSHACQLDTNVFYIVPEEAGLDIEYTVADSNIFCNPQTHTVILNSQGSGDMINITTQVDLSNTVKTYAPNSGRLEFPAGEFTPFEPDSNLMWHFNDIPHFANNGFVFLDGTAKLHFDLDGWSQSPDETISLFAVGETYCGDSISFNFEKDFKKVGLYGAFRKADSVPSCDTVPYTLCLNSLDTGIIRNMTASLDLTNTGYLYLANSASIEFPKGTFTSIEPTNLVWYFDTIAYLKQNGFADADSTLKLHFSLVQDGPAIVDSILIDVLGITDCVDSIQIRFKDPIPEPFGGDPAIDLISAEIIGNFCTYGEYTTFYNNEGFLDTLNIKYQLDSNVIGSDSVVLLFTNTDSRLDTSYSNIRDIGNGQHEYVLYPPYQIGSVIDLKLALAGISASNNGFCFEIIDVKGLVYDGNYCYLSDSDVIQDSIQVLRGSDNESINMISHTSCENSAGELEVIAKFQNPTPRDRKFQFRIINHIQGNVNYDWEPLTVVDSILGNNSETIDVIFTLPYYTSTVYSIEVEPISNSCNCVVGYYDVPPTGPCDDFIISENPMRKSYSSAKNHNHYSIEKLGINTVIAGTLFDSTSLTSTNTHVQLISPNGNIIWEKEFDFGAEDERCFDIAVTGDDKILLTGYQQDDAQSKRKLFVAKLDDQGSLLDVKSFNHENDWDALGFDVLASNNSDDYFVTGYSSEALLEKGSVKKAVLLKINSDLDIGWYKELEDSEGQYNVGNDLVEVGDQYVFVTGSTGSFDKNQNLLSVLYDFSGNQIWNLSSNTKKGENIVGVDAVYKEDGDEIYVLANSDKEETFEIYLIKDATRTSAFRGGVMSSDLPSYWKETAGYSLDLKPNTEKLWVAGLAKTMKKDGQFSNNSPTFIAQIDFDDNRFDWVKYMKNGNHDYHQHDHEVFEAFNGVNALYNYPDIMVVPNDLNVQVLDYESDGRTYRVGVSQFDHSGNGSTTLDCQVEITPDPINKSYVSISLNEEDLGGDNQEIITNPIIVGHGSFTSCPGVTSCGAYLQAYYSTQNLGYNQFKIQLLLISDEGDSVDVDINWGDGSDTTFRASSSQWDYFTNFVTHSFNKYNDCDSVIIVYSTTAPNGKPCRYEFKIAYSEIGVECGVPNPFYVKTYGNGDDHNHYSIEANAEGLFMAGTIYPKNELDNTDIHVQKTDTNGVVLWEKIYDLGNSERCMNMTLTEDNIVLTGGMQNASGDWEIILMKLSQFDGSIINEAVLQTGSASTNQVGVSVIYSEGVGKFFVVARAGDGSANPQSVLICTDHAFNFLWSKRIAPTWQGARELKAIEVIELANQEVLVLGHVGIQANGFAIKFDDSGNEEWQFCNMNYGATYSGVYDAQHDKVYLVSGDHSMRITTIDNVSTPNYTVTEKLFGLGASSTTAPNAISDFSMYNSIRDVALSEDEQRLLIYGASGNKGNEHTALITVQRANLTLLDISIFESGHSGSVVRRHFEHDSLLNSDMSSDSDVLTENSSNGMVRYGDKAYIIAYNNIVGSQDVQDEYNLYLHSYSDQGLKYLNCESSYLPSTPPINVTVGSCDLDLLDENYITVSINSTELGGNHNLVNDCVQIPRLKSPYANKNDELDNKIENLSEFSIYPNPTDGNLTVSFGEDKEKVGVRIFSTGGKVVLELQLYNTRKEQLDVSDFAKGMYFVELNIDGETYREKLIVQ